MEPNGLDSFLYEVGYCDSRLFLNVILSSGHTLHNMTAEGVRRLLQAGEAVAQVIAQPFGPKHGTPEQEPAGVLLLG